MSFAIEIRGSSTASVSVFTVVVVPLTVKSPATVKFPPVVIAPSSLAIVKADVPDTLLLWFFIIKLLLEEPSLVKVKPKVIAPELLFSTNKILLFLLPKSSPPKVIVLVAPSPVLSSVKLPLPTILPVTLTPVLVVSNFFEPLK